MVDEIDKNVLSRQSIELLNEISAISDYRSVVKKQFSSLARRLKLLVPMFEEIHDSEGLISENGLKALDSLVKALELAKELLRIGSEGSKIYLALEIEQIMVRFKAITALLEQTLSSILVENLDISDEVNEQVDLVLSQFIRAKGHFDPPDVELSEDLLCLCDKSDDNAADPIVLRRSVEKLQLGGIADLTQESLALREGVLILGSNREERLENMSTILKKIEDFVLMENPEIDSAVYKTSLPAMENNLESFTNRNDKNLIIPDDFRCPVSLELMSDPVIVATGQTYERSSIEKWLEAGHGTCPKTQQALTSTRLTPNYVLRSLISQWCATNGIESPRRPCSSCVSKPVTTCPAERSKIQALIQKLTSTDPEDLRSATCEIRLLSKRNTGNRVSLAEAGVIPLLVQLLPTSDPRTQEHAVTSLLNLSICERNKGSIISSGAVPGIVHVLEKGNPEARENAAATLFSLSVVDGIKVTLGAAGVMPPLVTLLREGTPRGKNDAAAAIFNLCIYPGNRGKAVRAGVIPTLMQLLTEPHGSLVDESLAILAILASHHEGRDIIGAAAAVPVLVDLISNSSLRNKENAATILVQLFCCDTKYIVDARGLGVMDPLLDLSQYGTERGKRKADRLLEQMNGFAETEKGTEMQVQATIQAQTQLPQPLSSNAVDS